LTNNGFYVQALENKVKEFLQVNNVVAVCNATTGLQIVAKALRLTGKVIMPSFTFVATAHAMKWIGLEPVFCDVTKMHNIDPYLVRTKIGDDVSAVLGVHLWGNPCYCNLLESITGMNDIKLIFDAAHAFGCAHGDKMIGNFGSAEVFSLHATKCINSFEGGLITTNDDSLAQSCRELRNFGFVGYDDVQSIGINGKMSEIHAAMGLAMLDLYPQIAKRNQEIFEQYFDILSPLNGIFILQPTDVLHNYQYIVTEIRQETIGISRDTVLEALHERGIVARRYFYPGIHKMPMYDDGITILPITEKLCRDVLVLPTGFSMKDEHVTFVCNVIKESLNL
jgi:dTDP-4-amino-4,6-dideoxygalactose transaminase